MDQPVKPFTEERLLAFLKAHNIAVAPGSSVAATASNVIANWVRDSADKAEQLVPDPSEAISRKAVLLTAEKALRKNPFQDALSQN